MKVIALEAGESDLYASEKTLRTIQGFLNVYSGTSEASPLLRARSRGASRSKASHKGGNSAAHGNRASPGRNAEPGMRRRL